MLIILFLWYNAPSDMKISYLLHCVLYEDELSHDLFQLVV